MPPKSKKTPTDSKFEFWANLPVEMQMECIKRMDFKTRMQLRATSKQDKSLVESAPKYHFKTVILSILGSACPRASYEYEYVTDDAATIKLISGASPEYTEKTNQFVAQITKFSTAVVLTVSAYAENLNDVSKFLADISNLATYNFQKLNIVSKWYEVVEFFLKNNNHVENIQLSLERGFERIKLLEFVTFPSVINAEYVRISALTNVEIPYQLIRKWLEKEDLEVGKKVFIVTSYIGMINALSERFASRKISDTSDEYKLISTNNPTKAIKIGPFDFTPEFFLAIHISVVEYHPSEQNRENSNLGVAAFALPNV